MWNELRKMAGRKPIICVDADGTLCAFDKYEKNVYGKINQEVVEGLKKLKDMGAILILRTARDADEEKALIEHVQKNNVYDLFDSVRAGEKPKAIAYLDDEAVNVNDKDWLEKLEKMLSEVIKK